jgi:hypothetical protein
MPIVPIPGHAMTAHSEDRTRGFGELGGFGGWASRANSFRGWGSMRAGGFGGGRFGGFHGGFRR